MKKEDKDKLDITYGIFKFKIPSKMEQTSALCLPGESTVLKKILASDIDYFYDGIQQPDIGDWLFECKEFGQTHSEYLNSGIVPVQNEKDIIYLVPLSFGEGVTIDKGFVTGLLQICESYFYGMKVKILEKKIDFNDYLIKIRMNKITNKIQFSSNKMIDVLASEIPNDAFCLIAFTDQDLYKIPREKEEVMKEDDEEESETVTEVDNFCYGQSNLKKRVGIFSFARYDPQFYVKKIKNINSEKHQEKLMKYFFILFKRASKVMVKEIAHMFGLKNCIYYTCNLNGFNSMIEFDKRPLEICPVCLRKLYFNITMKSKQDIKSRISNPYIIFDRFVKIKDCLSDNFPGVFERELVWYNARIDSIKKLI